MKAKKQSGQKLKVFKIDGGGEYNSIVFTKFYDENGVEHEVNAPYTPQQNVLLKEEIKLCLI